ncbi:MAG: SMI1/KNR4 family protein [Oscillatoriophycideae cyanobacterium NC_groundwater_1537_Pr4_S-0.65um_50_18]|nr:SMI1/KNR4 family protein [Oscillatoriophycideae cyanobacterium NC_groundwater_1537_Pr4_S-0.65um_50_18]
MSIPKAYQEFLLWTGNGQGLLAGDYHNWGYVASTNRNNALGIMQLAEHSPNLPEDAIVFIIYQGDHSFSFIRSSEGDNPPVHMFLERGDRAEMI